MKATVIRAVALALLAGLAPVGRAQPADATATVKDDARTAGHAVGHGAKTVGHSIAEKSRAAGHKIADDTRSARDTVRDDSKKTGHSIAEAARNVGRTVRDGFNRLRGSPTRKSGEPEPRAD